MPSERRAVERALAEVLDDPGPLYHRQIEEEPIWLLFVYLDTLCLNRAFANKRMQIRLRYGDCGTYQEKCSQKVYVSAGLSEPGVQPGSVVQLRGFVNSQELNGAVGVCQSWHADRERWHVRLGTGEVKAVQQQNLRLAGEVVANFGAMLIFRWSQHLAPALTLDVMKLGFMDRLISRSVLKLPVREGIASVVEQELLLQAMTPTSCFGGGKSKSTGAEEDDGLIGHLGVMVELQRFTMDQIRLGTGLSGNMQELSAILDMFMSDPRYAGAMPVSIPSPLRAPPMHHPRIVHGGGDGLHGYAAGTPVTVGGSPEVVVGRPVPGSGWSARNHASSRPP
mmetsp:Transcript_44319/g.102388  ORF Transcript_44319/g.102388 Transcript_44319/m.102388 type:complete len:337 (-) Transcript_44319:52-1062(-)